MKTDDKFDFLSKYGRQAYKDFYYAALFNFKTQMTVGKDYAKDTAKISNFPCSGIHYWGNRYGTINPIVI